MNLSKTFAAVQYASRKLLALNDEKINQILLAVADAAEERTDFILAENRKDLNRMDTSNPKYDRLMLTPERLKGIATDIRKVAKLPSPVGRVQKQGVMPNGLKIKRVSVPFGVIGIIYEARPNVSFDVFSLCLKSGNACILKGGSDAHRGTAPFRPRSHHRIAPCQRLCRSNHSARQQQSHQLCPPECHHSGDRNRRRHLPYIL